jgi:hypothetical protein
MLRVAAMMVVMHPAAVVMPRTARTPATIAATGFGVVGDTHNRQDGDQHSTNSLHHFYFPLKLRRGVLAPSDRFLGQKIAKMGKQGNNTAISLDFANIGPVPCVF